MVNNATATNEEATEELQETTEELRELRKLDNQVHDYGENPIGSQIRIVSN
jgi:hypothetical protein